MKKNIKLFVGILIGIIISAVVGVSATILYQADQVGFTPTDPNWNVNNLEDALNSLYNNRSSDIIYATGSVNKNVGVSTQTIEHDNDNAIIISNNDEMEYAINNTDTYISMSNFTSLGTVDDHMGLFYKTISVKAGDVINFRANTSWTYGYVIVY